MKYKQKAYKREQRKEQILLQFDVWYSNGDTEPKTMTRIARALDLTPSTKFTHILLELVADGKLVSDWYEKSGRWTSRGFVLNSEARTLSRVVLRRRITVSKRGVAVGQLELFS